MELKLKAPEDFTRPCPENGVTHDCTQEYLMYWPRESFDAWLERYVEAAKEKDQTRTEYRAVYRIPWYIGAPQEHRERGYLEYESDYAEDKETVRRQNYDLRNTEESHATMVRWETRQVSIGDWK